MRNIIQVLLISAMIPGLTSDAHARITASSCSCKTAVINRQYQKVLGSLLIHALDMPIHVKELLLSVGRCPEIRIEATSRVAAQFDGKAYCPRIGQTLVLRREQLVVRARLLDPVGPARAGEFWILVTPLGQHTRIDVRVRLSVVVDVPRLALTQRIVQGRVDAAARQRAEELLGTLGRFAAEEIGPGQLLLALLEATLIDDCAENEPVVP